MKQIDEYTLFSNRDEILARILPGKPILRRELVKETRLSPATVFRITRELVGQRVLKETPPSRGAVGRPSAVLELNEEFGSVLGCSLSMDTAQALLLNLRGEILLEMREPFDCRQGSAAILQALRKVVTDVQKNSPVNTPPLFGAGIAVPGKLNKNAGVSISFPRVADWQNVPIAKIINELTQVPVSVMGYGPSLALGEMAKRTEHDVRGLLCIEVAENIAMGMIFNGQLLEGVSGNAGELGHIPIERSGPVCYCGNQGCLETLATCTAVVDEIRRTKTALGGLSEAEITYERIVELAQKGDSFAKRLLGRVATVLADGVAIAVNILNPDVLVLSGRFFEAGELVMVPLLNSFHNRAFPVMAENLKIERSGMGREAPAFGAGVLAVRQALCRLTA